MSEQPAGAVLADIDVDVRRVLFVADGGALERLGLGDVVTFRFDELELCGRIATLRADGDQVIAGVLTAGSPYTASSPTHMRMAH